MCVLYVSFGSKVGPRTFGGVCCCLPTPMTLASGGSLALTWYKYDLRRVVFCSELGKGATGDRGISLQSC